MTRLQQARVRRTKLRASQTHLETVLDDVIPSLNVLPSQAFEAVLAYAIDGLVAQGTVRSRKDVLLFVSYALAKRGMN